jgi:hypothetical protein
MLLTYFLNDSEIVPVAPIITGITVVFIFHMLMIIIILNIIINHCRDLAKEGVISVFQCLICRQFLYTSLNPSE